MLIINSISKHFGGVKALNDLDLNIYHYLAKSIKLVITPHSEPFLLFDEIQIESFSTYPQMKWLANQMLHVRFNSRG